MSMLCIDFDEGNQSTYRAVYIYPEKEETRFASGNPVKDFNDALKYCRDNNISIPYSSSIENFLMDGESFGYTTHNKLKKIEWEQVQHEFPYSLTLLFRSEEEVQQYIDAMIHEHTDKYWIKASYNWTEVKQKEAQELVINMIPKGE
jgi:hypothetical protein